MNKNRSSDKENTSISTNNKQSKDVEPKSERSENRQIRRRPDVFAPFFSRDIEREFDRMLERTQRELDDLLRMPRWMSRPGQLGTMLMPSVDLEDKGTEYVLTADMPGFKKDDDIEINVTDDAIEIHAVKREEKEQQDKERNYIRHERQSEVYYRQMNLPEEVRSDDVKASLSDGILKITLPKKAPKKKRKIDLT
jgi:HSP20 family protein